MPFSQKNSLRGRPPLPSHKVRHNRVVTFLTDHDLESLQEISRSNSNTLSVTCYRIITEYLKNNRASALQITDER